MKKTLCVLIESLLLTSCLYIQTTKLFLMPNSIYFLILVCIYAVMGYVHAKIFVDNKVFSFLSIVFVGALAGLFLTILSPHYGPEGESQLFWFIIGAVTNIFVYSIFSSTLLLYIPSYIGWYIGNKK